MSKEIDDFSPDNVTEDEIKLTGSIKTKRVSKMEKFKKYMGFIIAGIIVVLVIAIIVVAKSLNKGDKRTYYDIVDTIVQTKKGTFEFVIDVRTEPLSAAKDADIVEGSAEDYDVDKEEPKNKYDSNAEWNKSDGTVASNERDYRNYKVTISGCCYNDQDLDMQFDVSIATEHFNDRFTTVTAVGGNYYIDVEQMRYWLKSSKNSNLIEIGKMLPEGKTYLVIKDDEFKMYSGYSEASEKYDNSITSFMDLYNRFCMTEKFVSTTLRGITPSTAMSSIDGVYSLSMTDADSSKALQKAFANMVVNVGDAHKSITNNLLKKELISDETSNALLKETDNIIDAFYPLALYIKTNNISPICVGNAREFVSGAGVKTWEAQWNGQCVMDDTVYMIKMSGTRSATAKQASVPNGSSVDMKNFGDELLQDTLMEILQYLNPFDVKLVNKLDITPTKIIENIRADFIKLVNSTKGAETYLDELTLDEYLEKWSNYELEDDSTSYEKINAELAKDFIKAVNDITGNSVVIEYIEDKKVQQFYEVDKTVNGLHIIANYNEELSNAKFTVVDLLVLNEGNDATGIALTDFSLQNLITSKFPANMEEIIRGYDSTFDFDSMPTDVHLLPGEFQRVNLYFVTENGLEYLDLCFDGQVLGEIVAY